MHTVTASFNTTVRQTKCVSDQNVSAKKNLRGIPCKSNWNWEKAVQVPQWNAANSRIFFQAENVWKVEMASVIDLVHWEKWDAKCFQKIITNL